MVSEEPTTYPVTTSSILPVPTTEKPISDETFNPFSTLIISIVSFLAVCLILSLLYCHFYQVGRQIENWIKGVHKDKAKMQTQKTSKGLTPQPPPRVKRSRSRSPDILGYDFKKDSLA